MEPLQKQVITLSHKVDAHQVVDQLSGKMSDAFSECRLAPIQERTVWVWTVLGATQLKAIGNRRWNTKTSWQIVAAWIPTSKW